MAQHDPKKAEHAHGHAHGTEASSLDQIQARLDDAKAELAKAIPEIESDSLKQHRQIDRIEAAKRKWTLTHEPDDPFDPGQFEPPMVPLKVDPKKHQAFHQLHYKIAKIEAELAAAMKAATTAE